MKAHAQLHQYFRDSCRNDTGSIKEAYELSLAAEKHYAQQEADIVNLKAKIASQANMIDKLQVKAGHVDLLRESAEGLLHHSIMANNVLASAFGDDSWDEPMIHTAQALEQTKES